MFNREEIDLGEIMDFDFDVECSADTETASQYPESKGASLSLQEVMNLHEACSETCK